MALQLYYSWIAYQITLVEDCLQTGSKSKAEVRVNGILRNYTVHSRLNLKFGSLGLSSVEQVCSIIMAYRLLKISYIEKRSKSGNLDYQPKRTFQSKYLGSYFVWGWFFFYLFFTANWRSCENIFSPKSSFLLKNRLNQNIQRALPSPCY